jgi:SAM-dependent methyltransferase
VNRELTPRDHPAAHFGAVAAGYARHRPTYPDALFDWLATVAPGLDHAWDCATGNGQAAVALARHFAHVTATDLSEAQLMQATAHPRVTYGLAPADASGLPDASCQLVTVAQALHWFDVAAFGREAARVLVPGGVVAAWSYGLFTCDAAVDEAVLELYRDVVGPYWPAGREHVENGYRDLRLPGIPLVAPAFSIVRHWTFNDLTGYLATWSAVERYRQAHGVDPLGLVRRRLALAWGDVLRVRDIRWPLALLASRVGTPSPSPAQPPSLSDHR